jgi:hypothetical protein
MAKQQAYNMISRWGKGKKLNVTFCRHLHLNATFSDAIALLMTNFNLNIRCLAIYYSNCLNGKGLRIRTSEQVGFRNVPISWTLKSSRLNKNYKVS